MIFKKIDIDQLHKNTELLYAGDQEFRFRRDSGYTATVLYDIVGSMSVSSRALYVLKCVSRQRCKYLSQEMLRILTDMGIQCVRAT